MIRLSRSIPKYPNRNTRVPSLAFTPLDQEITYYKYIGIDEWGTELYDEDNAQVLKCKITFSTTRFYTRSFPGYENEEKSYIFLRGMHNIERVDKLVYLLPNGVEKVFRPETTSYIYDMSGNVVETKVWVG